MYRLTKTRLAANLLAFSVDNTSNARYKAELRQELALLRQEYNTLLYGGEMMMQVCELQTGV
jgi:hypothetical protein